MGPVFLAGLIGQLVWFYSLLLIVYIIMSWIPLEGALHDVYRVLGSVCEPYLGLFRRFIPPIGAFDFSPIVALFVLQILARIVIQILT